jgi:glycosyltransferase involved in cell wall biosynthesis
MRKPILLCVIDSLGRGGAETLLIGILPDLSISYEIILVTLTDLCDFKEEEIISSKRYSLNVTNKFSLFFSIIKLKKIIRLHKPDLIHAHLVNSSIVARMANSTGIPIAISLHSILSKNVYNNSFIYRTIEKKIFSKKHFAIAVSNDVLEDYESSIGLPEKSFLLTNYVDGAFINNASVKAKKIAKFPLKIVSVGNIKRVKNYELLIDCFMLLKDYDISLDIFGTGESSYLKELQRIIDVNKLAVKFVGSSDNISTHLKKYDLFVMSSHHEGFGMAVVEAMAIGLPLLLSDLKVLRTVTHQNAVFFDQNDPRSLANILVNIYDGNINLIDYSETGIELAKKHYTKSLYLKKINEIYFYILNLTNKS